MDPLTILSTVISTSTAIYTWLDKLKSKEKAILDLKTSLSSISLVLHPLREKAAGGLLDSQPGVIACVQDLGQCLDSAREHLQTWQDSETRKIGTVLRRVLAFFDPAQVLEMVDQDRARIAQAIATLTLAIQLAWIPNGSTQAQLSPLEMLRNQEIREFWTRNFGESGPHSFRCPIPLFRAALGTWLGTTIPDTLIFQLDEQGFGSVTPASFDRMVGTQSIAQAVLPKVQPGPPVVPQIDPLNILVAEHRDTFQPIIDYAESLGIKVASFSSHAALKSWMELNDQFVRSLATAHRLRFLSDSVRNEGGMFNPSAGESLLRYLRGRMIPSPCLVFSPSSVATTEYVLGYTRAGSTSEPQIVFGYIRALAEGMRDTEWVGFNVQKPGAQTPQNPTLRPHFIKPLLLYLVGTKPDQDQVNIDYASSLGITVVALFSLEELRRYVQGNRDELNRIAATHRIRFITQNVRLEQGVLVLSAGEDTIKYIRAQGFAAPVLVLASSTIANTRFVSLYGRAGSTADGKIVRGFVDALARGVRDIEWVGFDSRK